MTTLLDFLGTNIKKWWYKKSNHGTINKLKYIILAQRVVHKSYSFANLNICKYKRN
jgi:hypothetical protein